MIRSIDELAKQADRYLEGEKVIEIDPKLIDGSFVSDRMEDDTEQYKELLEAIKERGQDSPVLVRPHPSSMAVTKLYSAIDGFVLLESSGERSGRLLRRWMTKRMSLRKGKKIPLVQT